MTPEHWQRMKELFRAALECEPSRRAAFLDEACAGDPSLREHLEALLACDEQAEGFMETPAAESCPTDRGEPRAGRRVGPYQIVREIGRGGMGTVHLATRADEAYRKHVAIKVVKRGMDTEAILRRFHQERQILADLDHPYIARLIDGGTTDDGLPYLVMDYVEGQPVDVYCDTHQLSVEARLELFRAVCSAVAYAHHHRIIHRDLKPGNILVTAEGVPKLLDFGIAKILDPERRSQTIDSLLGGRPMTPEYASPEQVRGEPVTPATDIYSLGVVLYELLTGHRPYHIKAATPQEIERVLCEQAPEKPSAAIGRVEEESSTNGSRPLTPEFVSETRERSPERLRHRLTGDLDHIILMALRKEPERRYASVAEFSEDIGRHLEGRPVLARPDTLVYRGMKFVRRNKVRVLAAALMTVLVLALIALGMERLRRPVLRMDKAVTSLAVLPLENLSRESEQEYFADGMTDALIADLAKIGALRVISRTSVMPYKGARQPLPEIAQALHVDTVVEGSVLRSGDRVRITVKLIQATTDRPLWGETYERDLGEILTLQSEVAQAITREIKIQLSPQERMRMTAPRPVPREAYDAYLKGRYFWWGNPSEERAIKSIEYFEQAVAKDPSYALAYAGLSDAYMRLHASHTQPPTEVLSKAKAAALRATELDDSLAEAHTALAVARLRCDWDWSGAERAFQRALALNPHYAHAHFFYGHLLADRGQREAAVAELKRAQDLDPLSLIVNMNLALTFYYTGSYDEAIEQARQTIDMDSGFSGGHWVLGLAYEQKGRYDEAIRELQKAVSISSIPLTVAYLGHAYAAAGQKGETRKLLNELQALARRRYVPPYSSALLYAGLGETDLAYEWLDKAYDNHDTQLLRLKADPRFAGFRSDPRFANLLRRVGLPP